MENNLSSTKQTEQEQPNNTEKTESSPNAPKEFGGFKGLEPTRYGDWDINGRCSDF